MIRFIARRIGTILITAVGIVYFAFLTMAFITGNPLLAVTTERIFILLRNTATEAGGFLLNVLRGDLGTVPVAVGITTNEQPVSEVLWFSFMNSMGLLLLALAGAALIGLLLGIVAALTKKEGRRTAFLLLSFAGISAPSFFLAVLLQTAGIRYTQTFGRRLVSMGGYAWEWDHMILPLLVLAARPVAYIARSTYVSLGDVMREDYIRTAFAKGLSLTRTVLFHALRNLAIPVLTATGVSLRFSLSALPIVEFIFAWPGMGRRMLEAINDGQPVLVAALALVIGLTIQLVSLLLEIIYHVVDPRMQEV